MTQDIMQTDPEGNPLADIADMVTKTEDRTGIIKARLDTVIANQEKIITAQNEIIDLLNNFSEMASQFTPANLPAPLRAMLGM